MSTVKQLEDRMTSVENELKDLKHKMPLAEELKRPWLDRIYGAFENNDAFLEAMEIGRKYRESQRPKSKKPKKTRKAS
jgi:hypothetical protein